MELVNRVFDLKRPIISFITLRATASRLPQPPESEKEIPLTMGCGGALLADLYNPNIIHTPSQALLPPCLFTDKKHSFLSSQSLKVSYFTFIHSPFVHFLYFILEMKRIMNLCVFNSSRSNLILVQLELVLFNSLLLSGNC